MLNEQLNQRNIAPSLDQLEAMVESVLLVDGLEKGLSFLDTARSLTTDSFLDLLTIRICSSISITCLYSDDVSLFNDWFSNILLKRWWPISSELFSQIITAHVDYLVRHVRVLKAEKEKRLQSNLEIIQSEDQAIRMGHDSLTNLLSLKEFATGSSGLAKYDVLVLLIGLVQIGEIDLAIEIYDKFIKNGSSPSSLMLDTLVCGISRKTVNDEIIGALVDQYAQYGLYPSIDAYTVLIRYTAMNDLKKARKYYRHATKYHSKESLDHIYRCCLTEKQPKAIIVQKFKSHFDSIMILDKLIESKVITMKGSGIWEFDSSYL